jgi:hypothetical protein
MAYFIKKHFHNSVSSGSSAQNHLNENETAVSLLPVLVFVSKTTEQISTRFSAGRLYSRPWIKL